MKNMKNVFLVLGIFATSLVSAQKGELKNMFKVGGNVGVAVPSDNASATVGVDFAYQNLVVPGFGLGVTTGYNHYFGKENDGIENNDFGVVPLAALVRIYPKDKGLYLGTDIGYAFITGDDAVAENSAVKRPDGGFYLKPEIGWHNREWNVALEYRTTFTGDDGKIQDQDFSASSLGVGVSYNFPLGRTLDK